jgi:hypothetical protein
MTSLNKKTISYRGKEYSAAFIPNVFTSDNQMILIGSHSLNIALYNDDKGYVDEEAREIDEQVYAFIDDNFFSLGLEKFIEKAKALLD